MTEARRMRLDDQTLRELEIFDDSQGGPGLCGVLDRTRTKLGSRALRDRLAHPLVDIHDIRSVQRDLAFLRAHPVPLAITESDLFGAGRYADSRIHVSSRDGFGAQLAAVLQVMRFRDVREELARGVADAVALACTIGAYCRAQLRYDPEGRLGNLLRDTAVAASAVESAGRAHRRTAWSMVRCDAKLRGAGHRDLARLVAGAAELDALASLASFGVELGYCVPDIVEGHPYFTAADLRHPLLKTPVGNDFRLDRDGHVVFLTGPNMAGKTTFLKSVGVSQLLAQVGLLVPAQALRVASVDAIFTALNTTDDLTAGISYYLAEVRRMKQAAGVAAANGHSLILVDEAFRGTNVLDAAEATRLVVAGFSAVPGCSCLFASHLASVGQELAAHGVVLKSFTGNVSDGVASFDHRLRDGVSDQRLGLLLLEQEGVLQLLASAASDRDSARTPPTIQRCHNDG